MVCRGEHVGGMTSAEVTSRSSYKRRRSFAAFADAFIFRRTLAVGCEGCFTSTVTQGRSQCMDQSANQRWTQILEDAVAEISAIWSTPTHQDGSLPGWLNPRSHRDGTSWRVPGFNYRY